MARCLRKVEGEDFWIVYCNTADSLFPFMFDSSETGRYFIDKWEKDQTAWGKVESIPVIGHISLEELKEVLE